MTMQMAPPHEEEYGPFLEAILAGDHRQAFAVLRATMERGMSYVYEAIVQPAMQRVGELWHIHEISVADEHLATGVAQAAIAALYPLFPWPVGGPKAIVTCVQGERHELGARTVSDLLALAGWDTVFLGADVPLEAMLERVRKDRPVFVGLSATLPTHMPAVRKTIDRLRSQAPAVKILVGGRAMIAGMEEALGADAVAHSGSDAVHVARAWKP
jgi:methanogenic corrinoid protein MtbC1